MNANSLDFLANMNPPNVINPEKYSDTGQEPTVAPLREQLLENESHRLGLYTHPYVDIAHAAAEQAKEEPSMYPSANNSLAPSIATDYTSSEAQKRKSPLPTQNIHPLKKSFNTQSNAEEKKIVSALRKNIRDVMDMDQLDKDTLRAQHEESERLARVAEQQKLLREYQQREAVLTHFDRFVNQHRVRDPAELLPENVEGKMIKTETVDGEMSSKFIEKTLTDDDSLAGEGKFSKCDEESVGLDSSAPSEVVTIEDSSDDDDCIVLSDDEADLEEDADENDDPHNSGLHVKDEFNVPDHLGRVVINVGHPDEDEDIYIAPQIARIIKPHQIGGVRFLFDNIIESISRFKSTGGFGAILAHSMGLGKTLQVVCFCDIFLRYTPSKSVICVMPINTLQNWNAEFDLWTPKHSDNPEYIRPRHFDVFVLNDQQKTLTARARIILQWKQRGGVLLIGYELFRLLALKLSTAGRKRSKKNTFRNDENESHSPLLDEVYEALVKPGPDLIICDEGHRIKNAQAGISQALKQISTRRRIVLTGYPLQNNLLEYWCMVDFVRPNYLGTRTEFCNMFERPIQNGLCIDSTPDDIKLMRYRAHVLHSLLMGFVQRRSHTVLQQSLPEKQEFVILTRMSDLQKLLYDTFMNDIVRSKNVPNPLKAFAVCCKIWNHPDVLYDAIKVEMESGSIMDIEEVDESTPASRINKDGFPPPKPAPPNPTLSCPPPPLVSHETIAGSSTISPVISSSNTVLTCSTDENKTELADEQQKLHLFPNDFASKQNGLETNSDKVLTANSIYPGSSAIYPEMTQFGNPPLTNVNNLYQQDLQSTYFSYPTALNTLGGPLKPNYVGCMLKQTTSDTANTEDSHNSSSEIVDLDTNEIKTIETDIDMDKNLILNKIATDNSSTSETTMTELNSNKSEFESHLESSLASGETNDSEQRRGAEKITYDWALKFMKKYESGLISNSPKMEIFFCILNESIRIGDRVLVFSQSLLTLNLIEKFLHANIVPGEDVNWTYYRHYFRLDGSTTSQEREKFVNEFNTNTNVKLFLISTKAGSLGINLVGANRVIIFDASWNPCHDTQAIYRIYRYGQKRACYIYRFVMDKCLEKKIYDRQIKKQGMSDRVVDECNPDAHLSIKDVTNLCYDYDGEEDKANSADDFPKPIESYTDTIIKIILQNYKALLTKEPFFHESLLVDRKNDKLSQAEKRLAHRSYEIQKKTSAKQGVYTTSSRVQYSTVRQDGSLISKPIASVRPMQTTKNSSGLRTTRWIPAEVWQKQGMTAQEMSLPLDVVIPTNSSNKSKIIIKAGQRVMVLKSAKGIYMQLDSGKIIAIRTMNKTTPATTVTTTKPDKSVVIDITEEPDTTQQTTTATTVTTTGSTTCADAKTDQTILKNTNNISNKDPENNADYQNNSNGSTNNGQHTSQNDVSIQSNATSNSAEMANIYYGKNNTIANTEDHSKSTAKDNDQSTKSPEHNTTIAHKQQPQPIPQQQTSEHFQSVQQQMQTLAHSQIMHSQTAAASYGGPQHHQPFAAYTQHQAQLTPAPQSSTTLRNAGHYGSRPAELSTYSPYPHTQYTDYQTFGSQQQQQHTPQQQTPQQQTTQHQSSRYHNTSGNGNSVGGGSSGAVATQATTSTHPPTPSLTDFYASYYPQWSPFMLATSTAAAGQTNDTGHLMHHPHSHSYTSLGVGGGGPPAHSSSHSSHHSKVQTTTTHQTNQWQQYHP